MCCSRGVCGRSGMERGGCRRSRGLGGSRYRCGRLRSRRMRCGGLHGQCGCGRPMRGRGVRGGCVGSRRRRCSDIRPGATGCLRPAVGRGVEIEILSGRSRPVVVGRGAVGRFTACGLTRACLARRSGRRPRYGCLPRAPWAVAAAGHHGSSHLAGTGAGIHGGIAPLPRRHHARAGIRAARSIGVRRPSRGARLPLGRCLRTALASSTVRRTAEG